MNACGEHVNPESTYTFRLCLLKQETSIERERFVQNYCIVMGKNMSLLDSIKIKSQQIAMKTDQFIREHGVMAGMSFGAASIIVGITGVAANSVILPDRMSRAQPPICGRPSATDTAPTR